VRAPLPATPVRPLVYATAPVVTLASPPLAPPAVASSSSFAAMVPVVGRPSARPLAMPAQRIAQLEVRLQSILALEKAAQAGTPLSIEDMQELIRKESVARELTDLVQAATAVAPAPHDAWAGYSGSSNSSSISGGGGGGGGSGGGGGGGWALDLYASSRQGTA
jgi:uncharacterized membrane protein YgcG